MMMGPAGGPAQSAGQSLFDLAALLTDKDELASRIKALNEAESSALVAKEAADARIMEVAKIERRVGDREMAVGKREQKADAQEAELSRRELVLKAATKDHDQEHADRMGAVRAREEEVKRREDDVSGREAAVGLREKSAAEMIASAKETKAEWERKVAVLNAAMKA